MYNNCELRGASLVLTFEDFLVFAAKKTTSDERHPYKFTGIGGKVEKDETFLQGAMREAEEEIGRKIEIIPTDRTIIIKNDVVQIAHNVPEVPALIISRDNYFKGCDLLIYTFISKITAEPVLSSEHDAFLLIPIQFLNMIKSYGDSLTYSKALFHGAKIIKKDNFSLSDEDTISFIDSPEVYLKHIEYWIDFVHCDKP